PLSQPARERGSFGNPGPPCIPRTQAMTLFRPALLVAALAVAITQLASAADPTKPKPVAKVDKVEVEAPAIPQSTPMSEILKDSPKSDWRPLDPNNTLYME